MGPSPPRHRESSSLDRACLTALLEASEHAIYGQDLEGRFLFWNPAATRLYGHEPHELIAQPGRGGPRRDESASCFETEQVAKDGRRLAVSLSVSPIRDDQGSVLGTLTVVRDVTEQKRADRLLHEQREWFGATLAGVREAVITTDRAGTITSANAMAERLTGYSVAEVQGASIEEILCLVDTNTAQVVPSLYESVARTGKPLSISAATALVARDGARQVVEIDVSPILDQDKDLRGLLFIFATPAT